MYPGRKIISCVLSAATAVLIGCGATPATPPDAASAPEPGKKAVGLPNPASVHCIELGGTLIPQRDANGGEYALCALPDGSRCEEWALFRGECGNAPGVKP